MQMSNTIRFLWLFFGVASICTRAVSCAGQSEEQLRQLVATETSLINALRDYIDELEEQLDDIRAQLLPIEEVHQQVGDNVEQHIGNPLNVVTILKRFESDWPRLEQQANETRKLSKSQPDFDAELHLPSEEDYETALLNLLRLQSVYDLEPATLSLGIVNGLKVGSAMSWSDCLEMARKSDRIGDYAVAKYWVDTALGRLPVNVTSVTPMAVTEQERGKLQILEAAMFMDYRAGEFLSALTMAQELLSLRPNNQNALKAKARIERELQRQRVEVTTEKDKEQDQELGGKLLPKAKSKAKKKLVKSVEQLLIDELCRGAATQPAMSTGSRLLRCRQDVTNLHMVRMEPLSEDPHIMLYHDVYSFRQASKLITQLDDDDDDDDDVDEVSTFEPLEVSELSQRMLRGINYQLGLELGWERSWWQARRHSHKHVTEVETRADDDEERGPEARAMLNLQESRLGGALAFPQLELSVNVPRGGLLYWRTRSVNEFPGSTTRLDYRSRQLVCPVLLGTQLSLWTEFS